MEFMYFSIKYRYSDILLKNHKLHLNLLFCCNHTCYCVNMVLVTFVSCYMSVSCYHPQYQNRSSMYIGRLIPRNFGNWPRQLRFGKLYWSNSYLLKVDFVLENSADPALCFNLLGFFRGVTMLCPWVRHLIHFLVPVQPQEDLSRHDWDVKNQTNKK